MEPIEFKESNVTFAENQKEYKPLPAYKDDEGNVVTCWKLSFKERCRVLFTGRIWSHRMTFNMPLQPVFKSTKKSDILDE